MSSGGSLPSGTEVGEGGYHGETYGAELADLAYKGLGGIVPLHSRAFSTAPSTCFALCDFNGCCKQFHIISFHFISCPKRTLQVPLLYWPALVLYIKNNDRLLIEPPPKVLVIKIERRYANKYYK